MTNNTDLEKLIQEAKRVQKRAYAPYSKFSVGAAVLGGTGRIYTGCNIENSSFGLTICAERVALFKAISEGEETIPALVLITDTETTVWPCGACRQVLAEFSPNMQIVSVNKEGQREAKTLSGIFPDAFNRELLKK
jgi:cytidine deaminase